MTRMHRTRTARPAAAKREAARIVALIDAAAYAAACEARAIDDADWMGHADPFTRADLSEARRLMAKDLGDGDVIRAAIVDTATGEVIEQESI